MLLVARPKNDETLATRSAQDISFWEIGWDATISATTDSAVGGVSSRRMTATFDFDGVPSLAIAEASIHGDLAYTLYWWSPMGNEVADTATFEVVVDSCEFTL